MAHIRRKFHAAEKAAKRASPKAVVKASLALDMIKQLYVIEKEIKGKPSDLIRKTCQEKSKPLMKRLASWLESETAKTLPKSLLGKALSYALDQWPKMEVFLDDPLVAIDNNRSERAIRPFVIGRPNWLFSQSPSGAHASASLYSLIETAKANAIGPFGYLALIFKELPKVESVEGYERLLPYNAIDHFNLKPCQPPQ